MKRISKKLVICNCLAVLMFLMPAAVLAIQLTPTELTVGTTFNGKDVVVSGEMNSDEDIIVQVTGNASEAEFKQTGKVGGVFWMTVGHLSISNAPSAYFVYLPQDISQWRQNNEERWLNLQFDYDSLLSQIKIEPEPTDKQKVFADFMELKTHDGLYKVVENGVNYEQGKDGKKRFHAQIHVPSKMPVAQYKIKVYRVEEGKVQGVEQADLKLKETGFPLLINSLAFNHSLIYGVLSVIIAIFAGLFMGVIFQQRGGGAH
jgi:uncharacterized protein (TIGR02186 family)